MNLEDLTPEDRKVLEASVLERLEHRLPERLGPDWKGLLEKLHAPGVWVVLACALAALGLFWSTLQELPKLLQVLVYVIAWIGVMLMVLSYGYGPLTAFREFMTLVKLYMEERRDSDKQDPPVGDAIVLLAMGVRGGMFFIAIGIVTLAVVVLVDTVPAADIASLLSESSSATPR